MTFHMTALAKAILPAPLYAPLRTYYGRLVTWHRLMRHIRGVAVRDRLWLWLSFLASPFTAAGSLGDWRDPVLLYDVTAEVAGVGRFALRARTDDLWHVVPFRERAVLDRVRKMLRPGDCFVDAGANIGFYTVAAAAAVGRTGTVVAVEMMKGTAKILRDHIQANDAACARVVENALSARQNEVVVASMPAGSYGQASISDAGKGETFEVRTTTLDALLDETPSVRLMKMDIEGAELEALKGGAGVLDRVESIIFEHVHAKDFPEIRGLLSSHGFRIEQLDGSNSLPMRD